MARTATKRKPVAKKAKAPARVRRTGSYPVIDVHTHVALQPVIDFARANRAAAGGMPEWVPAVSAKEHERQARAAAKQLVDPKARLRDMDRMGVDIQLLSMNLPTPAYWVDGPKGMEAARLCNDGIAEFVAHDPDRFVGIAAVPLQDAKLAIKELDRAVNMLGLKGAWIASNIRNHDVGEKQFRPFWKKAAEMGVPVFIHPRGFTQPERLENYFLWNSIGQPLEEALAMSSLIYEGIMEDFPALKVAMCHGGGYLPYYPGRADRAFDSRPETRAHIKKRPSEYIKRFWYDSVVFDREMLANLVRKVGAGKVMLGTDYPRGEIETDPVGFINGSRKLTRDQKRQILGTNAARLLRIAA